MSETCQSVCHRVTAVSHFSENNVFPALGQYKSREVWSFVASSKNNSCDAENQQCRRWVITKTEN